MNKKKTGFTLVEILAVITILGVLLLIITPKVMDLISNSKNKLYDNQIKKIVDVAKTYHMNNTYDIVFTDDVAVITLQDLVDEGLLEAPIKNPKTGKDFDLRYSVKIIKNVKKYTFEFSTEILYVNSDISGSNQPEITGYMIPIYYDGATIKKADINNEVGTHQWHDYNAKKWANVVTVKSNRTAYLKAAVGTEIAAADINTMWVWIPRYAYKITSNYNTATTGTVAVEFLQNKANYGVDGATNYIKPIKSTEAATELEVGNLTAAQTTGLYVGGVQQKWIVHPAFTFGNTEIEGMWVAKFKASFDVDGDIEILPFKDIPATYIDNMYLKSRNMEKSTKYGWPVETGTLQTSGDFNSTTNNINTHFIKNTEWGAIVYLTHSQYGIGQLNVACNNYYSTSTKTGYGIPSRSVSACPAGSNVGVDTFPYNHPSAFNASTTANITGVYEMSGGVYEYTGGHYFNKTQANIVAYSSAFVATNLKYRDVYNTTFSTFKKGDALLEMSPGGSSGWYGWYGQIHNVLTTTFVSTMRSAAVNGSYLGDIYLARCTGGADQGCSLAFRPVLIPTD